MTLFPAQSYNTDIVGPLPESANGNHCVLIVVDRFSSRIFLYAHSKHCTAPEMAQLFVDEISYKAGRGLPLSVISDNDKLFTAGAGHYSEKKPRRWRKFGRVALITVGAA